MRSSVLWAFLTADLSERANSMVIWSYLMCQGQHGDVRSVTVLRVTGQSSENVFLVLKHCLYVV